MAISDNVKDRELDKFRGESRETTKVAIQIESAFGVDQLQEPVHFNGTVGTSTIKVPTVAGNAIFEMTVTNIEDTDATKDLLFSLDGGSTFATIKNDGVIELDNLGGLTQIDLKGAVASVGFEIIFTLVL